MRPPDMLPTGPDGQPISERAIRAHLAESLDPPADDAYAERDYGSVDDPYPDDFRDYYRMIELDGAL